MHYEIILFNKINIPRSVRRSCGILRPSPKDYGSNSVQSSLGKVLISLRRQSDCLRDLTDRLETTGKKDEFFYKILKKTNKEVICLVEIKYAAL